VVKHDEVGYTKHGRETLDMGTRYKERAYSRIQKKRGGCHMTVPHGNINAS
jgi:hypothetical protein